MTGKIPPTGFTGPEFNGPIENEQPTLQHRFPQKLSEAGKSNPLRSTGLPEETQNACFYNQAAALGGLRYASA